MSTDPRLVAQRRTLEQFAVTDARYGHLKYAPWTIEPSTSHPHLRLAPSKLIAGTIGVFPVSKQFAPGRKVVDYPGLLMTVEMHDDFNRLYHCPTAVRVSVLDYEVDLITARLLGLKARTHTAWQVRMVLIGDPSHPGAIINSPRGLNQLPNCHLRTCKPQHIQRYLTADRGDKIQVHSQLVFIHHNDQPVHSPASDVELLQCYDEDEDATTEVNGESFWLRTTSPFCDQCCLKSSITSNPLLECSFEGCSSKRHTTCLIGNQSNGTWYCGRHKVLNRGVLSAAVYSPYLARQPPFSSRVHINRLLSKFVDQMTQPTQDIISPSKYQPVGSQSGPTQTVGYQPQVPIRSMTTPQQCHVGPANYSPYLARAPTCLSTKSSQCQARLKLLSRFIDRPSRPMTQLSRSHSGPPACLHQTHIEAPLSSAPIAPKPIGTPKLILAKKLNVEPLMILTDRAKDQIRAIWSEFEPFIKKSTKRVRWHITAADHGTNKEAAHFRELEEAWSILTSCATCKVATASYETFTSCSSLLKAQLRFKQQWNFNRTTFQTHVRSQLRAPVQVLHWNEITLCPTCFAVANGFSRSTLFRIRALGPPVKVKRMKVHLNLSEQLLGHFLDMVNEEGQSLPTSDGARADAYHRVLPYMTQASARHRLEWRVQQQMGETWPIEIAATTFQRLVNELFHQHGMTINIKKNKKLARCAKCEEYTNKLELARLGGDATQIETCMRVFQEHTIEWQRERMFFEGKKRIALQQPWALNTLTLDGMDTAKTNLPHYHRASKHPDTQHQLPIRVVGGFCFGGAVPCIGVSSFDDVPAKGASASITVLERMINMQFEALDTKRIASIPGSNFDFSGLNSINAAPIAASSVPTATASAVDLFWNEDASSTDPDRLVSFMWPEGLHVTFDNTSGDCKNGSMFRFLAYLVGAGVYRYITVSTLIVGHTHDIVDQMFSVWSRILGVEDAPTLEKMHTLFRRKYESKIYELEKLMIGLRRSGESPAESPPIADRLVEMAHELGVQPELVLQTFCIDSSMWCTMKLPNISRPHVFYIVKENVDSRHSIGIKEDAVVMYNRFLSNSCDDSSVHHNAAFQGVRFGPWTTRRILLRLHEIPMTDPQRVPPQFIDTTGVRRNVELRRTNAKSLHTEGKECNMSEEDAKQMIDRLDRMDSNLDHLKDECPRCFEFSQSLSLIGPIRRPAQATEHETELANNQTRRKTAILEARIRHLERALPGSHPSLQVKGWWTKWLDRVQSVIEPYYIARGLISNPTEEQRNLSGRSQHPFDLVRDEGLAPISHHRPDQIWKRTKQPPQLGDIIVARGDSPKSPFWLGQLVRADSIPSVPAEIDASVEPDDLPLESHQSSIDPDDLPLNTFLIPPPKPAARASKSMARPSGTPLIESSESEAEIDSDDSDYEYQQKEQARKRKRSDLKRSSFAGKGRKFRPDQPSASAARSSGSIESESIHLLVQWYHFLDNATTKKMLPNDDTNWHKMAKKAGVLEAWESAVRTFKAGHFTRIPEAMLDRWKGVTFVTDTSAPEAMPHVDQLIAWGSPSSILTDGGKLKAHIFRRVKEDLSESEDARHGMSIDHVGAAAAGAARAAPPAAAASPAADLPVPMDIDDSRS